MGFFKDCGCGCGGAKAQQKFLISVMSALVFFIIANPDTFRLTRSIFGQWVAGPTGCPSVRGLMLHTVVFILITYAMMNIKKEGYATFENEAIGPSPEIAVGPSPMPKMAEMPSPLPGFSEEQFDMFDSGLVLGSMDITEEVDRPVKLHITVGSEVTCGCDDGSKVVISK